MNLLRHPRAPTVFLAHVCAMALLMVFAMAIGLSWSHLPMIEGYVFPVVKATETKPTPTRAHDRACFSLAMRKVRTADAIVYQFSVEARQNRNWLSPVLLAAHIANDDDTEAVEDDYTTHPVGDAWVRRWCAELPAIVADSQPIRISGYALHRAHPLWTTETPMPSIVIDAANPP